MRNNDIPWQSFSGFSVGFFIYTMADLTAGSYLNSLCLAHMHMHCCIQSWNQILCWDGPQTMHRLEDLRYNCAFFFTLVYLSPDMVVCDNQNDCLFCCWITGSTSNIITTYEYSSFKKQIIIITFFLSTLTATRGVCIICVPTTMLSPHLVLLDSTVDTADEGVGGIETNRPCQQPEPNSHDECVSKVEHCGDQVHNLELQGKVR